MKKLIEKPQYLAILKKAFRYAVALFLLSSSALIIWAFRSRTLPKLETWHAPLNDEFTHKSNNEFTFEQYLELEDKLFSSLETEIIKKASSEATWTPNRYIKGSPSDPKKIFPRNWNRTQILNPIGEPQAVVLLLHGLTDSPYSMRALAESYQKKGSLVICLRLPGHGTTPGALTSSSWKDWLAILKITAKHLQSQAPDKPFFLVGYSNGGALALKYVTDIITDETAKPDKIYLINPAVGVTRLASLSNLHKTLSWIPYFKKFSWLNITPEYDPFKYNSFPKNAAHQSHLLSEEIATSLKKIDRTQLPPIITFQSIVDATVCLQSLIETIYMPGGHPENNLILFDINRFSPLAPFIKKDDEQIFQDFTSRSDLPFQLDIVTNANQNTQDIVIKTKQPKSSEWNVKPTKFSWTETMYSLSHEALPFKPNDPYYGNQPDDQDEVVIQLGVTFPRGEKGSLSIPSENLLRLRSNPFFEIIENKIVN